jgi:hypothetical protein
MKIGLCDKEFEHILEPTRYHDHAMPKLMQWDRETPEQNKVVVFTERQYNEALKQKYKDCIRCAWALESPDIHPEAINDLARGWHRNFDFIITHSRPFMRWLKENSKAKGIWFSPAGGWIWEADHKIYEKTKNIQMIGSRKKITMGHKLRFEVAEAVGDRVDKYGWAFKKFDYTLDVFKDYRFAIVIENCIHHDYFTDKLTSAFYTGTIPIMHNDGFISKYFNTKGMFLWQGVEELDSIIAECTEKRYLAMLPYIRENFEEAKKYYCPDDFIYKQFQNIGIV